MSMKNIVAVFPFLLASITLVPGCNPRQFNGDKAKSSVFASQGNLYRIEIKNGTTVVTGSDAKAIIDAPNDASKRELALLALSGQIPYLMGSVPKEKASLSYDSFPEPTSITASGDGTVTIGYQVSLLIISKDPAFPAAAAPFKAYLPRSTDEKAKLAFYQRFKDCSIHDLSGMPNDSQRANAFFYHMSVYKPGCGIIADAESGSKDLVIISAPHQLLSTKKNGLKRPEYEMVWSDGKLKASIIIALTSDETDLVSARQESHNDAGVAAYNMLYSKLRRSFPDYHVAIDGLSTAPESRFVPAPDYRHFAFTGKAPRGDVEISVTLIPTSKLSELRENDPARTRYERNSRDSDLIVYAGHADYGGNIESLNKWGSFQRDHYTLFFFNSCWSLGYTSNISKSTTTDGILNRLSQLNGGTPGTRYADFLVNGDTANMYSTAKNIQVLIDALREGTLGYGEILAGLDQNSMPIIVGEEDNP
jgi:hypothetical protein